jgi:hypothetical protein
MAGHANVIEQAVQLADDSRDLLGKVARVHCDCRPASSLSNAYVGHPCIVGPWMLLAVWMRCDSVGEAQEGG